MTIRSDSYSTYALKGAAAMIPESMINALISASRALLTVMEAASEAPLWEQEAATWRVARAVVEVQKALVEAERAQS